MRNYLRCFCISRLNFQHESFEWHDCLYTVYTRLPHRHQQKFSYFTLCRVVRSLLIRSTIFYSLHNLKRDTKISQYFRFGLQRAAKFFDIFIQLICGIAYNIAIQSSVKTKALIANTRKALSITVSRTNTTEKKCK